MTERMTTIPPFWSYEDLALLLAAILPCFVVGVHAGPR